MKFSHPLVLFEAELGRHLLFPQTEVSHHLVSLVAELGRGLPVSHTVLQHNLELVLAAECVLCRLGASRLVGAGTVHWRFSTFPISVSGLILGSDHLETSSF